MLFLLFFGRYILIFVLTVFPLQLEAFEVIEPPNSDSIFNI